MKIVYISGTRADYEAMRPVLFALKNEPALDLEVLVTGMHLRAKYGSTIDRIKQDGFAIHSKADTLHTEQTAASVTMSLGETICAMTKSLENKKPDVLLLLGDRDEQLAAAICGSHMNICMAQVHAGERSGSVDESNRHAISRFAHLLFCANQDSYDRLIKTGEQNFRVHRVGAPAIDHFKTNPVIDRPELQTITGIQTIAEPYLVLLQHPVSYQEQDAGKQIIESLKAATESGLECIAYVPNSDAGGDLIRDELTKWETNGKIKLITHLPHHVFASLIHHAEVLLGNSSSGIVEAAYLQTAVVNVGIRQNLRFRGKHVIDVDHDAKQIAAAIDRARTSKEFRSHLEDNRFIWGDGHASEKICQVIKTYDWKSERVRFKEMAY